MVKVRARDLRSLSKEELLKRLEEYRNELAGLRVVQATNGAANRLAQIKNVRKAIARVLTVYNTNEKGAIRTQVAGKKYQPKDIRAKKTRAIRRALSTRQQKLVVTAVKKRQLNFPVRRFALKA